MNDIIWPQNRIAHTRDRVATKTLRKEKLEVGS